MELKELKFGDIVILRNENITIYTEGQIKGQINFNDGGYIYTSTYNKNFEHDDYCDYDIMEIKRLRQFDRAFYKFETLYKRKKEIIGTLTEKEKEYLSIVIEPFKDRVSSIYKADDIGVQYIVIEIKNDGIIEFPCFKKDTKYKGMEEEKRYTIEELGL